MAISFSGTISYYFSRKGEKTKMILETFLIAAALPFVGLSLYFGTKGGYYDSDDYKGDGCAHDVKR